MGRACAQLRAAVWYDLDIPMIISTLTARSLSAIGRGRG